MRAYSPVFLFWLLCLVVLVGGLVPPAAAQASGPDCTARTATNASLILPSDLKITLNGTATNGPWRIDVFTTQGKCAGTTHWDGTATTLTAWGTRTAPHAPPPPSEAAFAPGDTMHVRLFNPETGTQYETTSTTISVTFRSEPSHLQTAPVYAPDGMYVLDRIRIRAPLVQREK